MGRQAKLRQQRKQSDRADNRSATPEEKTPTTFKASPQPKNQSFFGKLVKWLNPFSKETEDLSWLEDERDLTAENNRLVGAVAWEGYQTQKRGFVFVQEFEDVPPQLEYISRRSLKKNLRKQGVTEEEMKAIEDSIASYDPEQSVVLVYRSLSGEIGVSMPTLDPPPPECYALAQGESD
jgi:hypothetical protein